MCIRDRVETQKKPANKKLTVEKIYQKKSQLEHILLRPDTYIGNVFLETIFDKEKNIKSENICIYVY